MKKRIISMALVPILMFCCFISSASALQNASEYLSSYSTEAVALSGGRIALDFIVNGTRVMDRIGARKIVVYEQNGSLWSLAASYDSDDEGMSKSDAIHFGNTLYFSGTAGTYYQVIITVFAENSSGSDSRTQIHYVTARP